MIIKVKVFILLILIYIYDVHCVDNHVSLKQNALLRYRRQASNCKGRFLCTNFNQCIHFKLVCNGINDCSDGSDEVDCDVSLNSARKNSCHPPIIQNGQFTIEEKYAAEYIPGSPVPDSAFINIKCDTDYVLQPNFDSIGCNDGKWSISFPRCLPICPDIKTVTSEPTQCFMNDNFVKCNEQLLDAVAISKCKGSVNSTQTGLRASICSAGSWFNLFYDCIYENDKIKNTCPPRFSTNSIEVNCTLNNQPVDCTQTVEEGTIAVSKCKNYYSSTQGDISISTCTDGAWDSPPIHCESECGEEVPDGVIFIINTFNVKKGQFPWPVGIYVKDKGNYNYHCSGTIISPTAVLSVARCFSYPYNSIPAENFIIGAGKTFKNFNTTEKFVQNRQVKSIHIPPNYNANEGDIAVIIIKDPFELTNVVRPVCIDWDGTVESQNYNPSALGNIVEWGKDKKKDDVETRVTNGLSQYVKETCLKDLPPKYFSAVTNDKICTNFTRDSGLCQGDRGNGLAFRLNFNYTQKYFLRGIASNAIGSDKCEDSLRTLYTKVAPYTNFIQSVIQRSEEVKCPPRYRQTSSTEIKCILNGIFVDCSQPVLDGTIAISRCKNPDSSKTRIKFSVSRCSEGAWNKPLINCQSSNPATLEFCPPRVSETTNVKCLLEDKPVNCNTSVVEGTVAIAECKDFYIPIGNEISISRCTKGSWNNPLIHCKPLQPIKLECGEAKPGGELFSVNTEKSKKGSFPWHVALYKFKEKKYIYQCGGSIITPTIVLSAAHCFTIPETGSKFPAEDFYLGAGKYYRPFNSEKDSFAQYRQVKECHIPENYRGFETNFAGDIAVLVVNKPFVLSNLIQPVCIEWDNKIENQQLVPNNRGNVVGWGSTHPRNEKLSDELKQLNAPFIGVRQCLDNVPANFRRWVTADKFCAGYTNGSSVCSGDSGGGMVFKWISDNLQKYYIRGIVSVGVGPTEEDPNLICDNNRYSAYTKVSVYSNFILNIIKQNIKE